MLPPQGLRADPQIRPVRVEDDLVDRVGSRDGRTYRPRCGLETSTRAVCGSRRRERCEHGHHHNQRTDQGAASVPRLAERGAAPRRPGNQAPAQVGRKAPGPPDGAAAQPLKAGLKGLPQ